MIPLNVYVIVFVHHTGSEIISEVVYIFLNKCLLCWDFIHAKSQSGEWRGQYQAYVMQSVCSAVCM